MGKLIRVNFRLKREERDRLVRQMSREVNITLRTEALREIELHMVEAQRLFLRYFGPNRRVERKI